MTPTGYAQVAEELVSGAVTVRYTHGIQRISQSRTGVTHFYGYDGGGSVRQLTDASGAVTDTYTFDAFGVLIGGTGSTANAYRYRGEQWDASVGMYYLRARWYEAGKGRFWTADKWEPEEPRTCGAIASDLLRGTAPHLFTYTSGDPVNFIDPSGKKFIDKAVLIGVVLFHAGSRYVSQLPVILPRIAAYACRPLAAVIFVAWELIEWGQFAAGGPLPQPDMKEWIKAYCSAMGY